MLNVHNKTLREAKLPLSVCRGNQKDRRKLAHNLNYSFLNRLKGYDSLNEDVVTKELDAFLGDNKIDVSFSPQSKESPNLATLAPKYHVERKDGELYNVCSGFDFRFRNLRNLKKKFVAHEFSHFFGKITNPKTLNIEGAPYCGNMEEWKLCEGVLDKYFRPQSKINKEKDAVNDVYQTLQSVPKNMRISALKMCKKQLLSEKAAYYDERVWAIKFAKGPVAKFSGIKDYVDSLILEKTVLKFNKKQRVLDKVIFRTFNPE